MIKLILKDFKLFFKDKQSVILTFLLPIILISLSAFSFGGIGKGDEGFDPIDILICDLDSTHSSAEIIAELDLLKGLKIRRVALLKSKELVRKGDYAAALIIHQGFEASLSKQRELPVELLFDEVKEMEVGLLQSIITGPFEKIQVGDIDFLDYNRNSRFRMTSIVGDINTVSPGLIHAVCGTAILMLLFSVAGLGASILEEKEKGTLKRLLYSPLNANAVLFGKMLFTFFVAILQLIIMFSFSWLVFGLDVFVNISALILMIIATAFAVSSFGIFLASVSKTRRQAQSLSTLIILVMSTIGGSIIPIFIMPAIMEKIAMFSVNYWGLQGFYDVLWRKLPLIEIMPKMLVLVGIGISITSVSIRLFHKNVMKMA